MVRHEQPSREATACQGSMMFAIKAEVSDPSAETFAFNAQKTMYGGKHIAKGDTIFVFASENEGGQGPDGWRLLADELKRRGHGVLTPAFEVSRTDAGLAWHAETIVNALDNSGMNPADVVCVAHSASGMYLPLIAERWSPRRMVFLAAVVPRPGVSVMEQHRNDPSMFNPAWVRQNPQDEKVAVEFVYHDCLPDRLDWEVSTRVMFYARRALEERCPLRAWPQVPS